MAVVMVHASPRRRLPQPGHWQPAQIQFRLMSDIPREGYDLLETKISGGVWLGAWRISEVGGPTDIRVNDH